MFGMRGIRAVHKSNKSELLLIDEKIWSSSGGVGEIKCIKRSQAIKETTQAVVIIDTVIELQEMWRDRQDK